MLLHVNETLRIDFCIAYLCADWNVLDPCVKAVQTNFALLKMKRLKID